MLPAQLMFLVTGPTFFRQISPSWWAAASLHPALAILYALQVRRGSVLEYSGFRVHGVVFPEP